MWPESKDVNKGAKPPSLKTGLTTGCCATACCVAAAHACFTGEVASRFVSVTLPSKKASQPLQGKTVDLEIFDIKKVSGKFYASTIKDAGDDPDVTHGATVWVCVELTKCPGVKFFAGEGVGTVTRDGLSLAVGEPAINPVPRSMMQVHLDGIANEFNYNGGFNVTVGIMNGAELALKTMNPKLGILGGLSVLGTSGIVRPFSCSAYIASIHQGVDVALANDEQHIAASTGNLSEQALQELYGLNDMAMIEMGDFVGALLKHIRARFKQGKSTPQRLTICAGFGKLTKLASGHMDLHSRASSIDFDALFHWVSVLGGDDFLLDKVKNANTSIEVLKHCQADEIGLAKHVCLEAKKHVMAIVPSHVQVELLAIDRKGSVVGSSSQC